MKTKIVLMVSVVLIVFLSPVTFAADNKDFYESGQIVDGEVWNTVNIYNDDTIVDMVGGTVDFIHIYDESTLNVTAGNASMRTHNSSNIDIFGGDLGSVEAWDNGNIEISDNPYILSLTALNFGIIDVYGGTVDHIGAGMNSMINIHNVDIIDEISVGEQAAINIYGYDLNKFNTGGKYNNGYVAGYWFNDESFQIDFGHPDTFSNVYLIPEPTSLLLFCLGSILVRRKN